MRAARQAAGISLSRLSELTHYSKAYLSQLETGRRTVQANHVAAYEDALGVRVHLATRVELADVELVEQATNAVTSIGLRHGGIAVADMAHSQFEWTRGLLRLEATTSVRLALFGQSARLADRVAWSLDAAGRKDRATAMYERALTLAKDSPGARATVAVDLANHLAGLNEPARSLDLLEGLTATHPVLEFTAHAARARAYAALGDWQATVRHVGIADEAHARVDLADLPGTHKPFASGHDAHAHREAGAAYYDLARHGERRAVPRAAERLSSAIERFGPDRASAVKHCQARLARL